MMSFFSRVDGNRTEYRFGVVLELSAGGFSSVMELEATVRVALWANSPTFEYMDLRFKVPRKRGFKLGSDYRGDKEPQSSAKKRHASVY